MPKNIIIVISILAIITIGGLFLNSNNKTPKEEVALSKKIETPEKAPSGEFVSALVEFKVKTEKDKYTITYPRGKFKTEELSKEVKKVIDKTDMGDANKLSLVAGLSMNESFYMDTNSECGFDEPSSAWCMRISNNKELKTVESIIQKGKFETKAL